MAVRMMPNKAAAVARRCRFSRGPLLCFLSVGMVLFRYLPTGLSIGGGDENLLIVCRSSVSERIAPIAEVTTDLEGV